MDDRTLLDRLDAVILFMDSLSSNKHSQNQPTENVTEPTNRKCNSHTHQELTLSKSNRTGGYQYNRFGYDEWLKVAFKLEAKYNLDDTVSLQKQKKKQKQRYPKCVLTASGMNAISAVFHGILLHHKHDSINIIYSNELYCDTPRLIQYFQQMVNPNINLIPIQNICNAKQLTQLFASDIIKQCSTNILFFESCSNPNGFVMDFNLIDVLKRNSKGNCYVIVDNTWLTSSIFNPFECGADFVVTSLSKYYSAGQCIGGAVLHHGKTPNNCEIFKMISNWVRINGIHLSPIHCTLVSAALDTIDDRIRKTSQTTVQCAEWMHGCIGKGLMDVNHVSLKEHVSHGLYCKYIDATLFPSVVSFKVRTTKMNRVRKWLGSSQMLPLKTSFGGADSRFDSYPSRDPDRLGIWCRMAIGYEDNLDAVKKDLHQMMDKLNILFESQ
eukprot:43567_1